MKKMVTLISPSHTVGSKQFFRVDVILPVEKSPSHTVGSKLICPHFVLLGRCKIAIPHGGLKTELHQDCATKTSVCIAIPHGGLKTGVSKVFCVPHREIAIPHGGLKTYR